MMHKREFSIQSLGFGSRLSNCEMLQAASTRNLTREQDFKMS